MTTNLPLHQLSTITTGQPFKYTAGEPKTDLWLRPPLGKRVGPGSQRVRGSRASVPISPVSRRVTVTPPESKFLKHYQYWSLSSPRLSSSSAPPRRCCFLATPELSEPHPIQSPSSWFPSPRRTPSLAVGWKRSRGCSLPAPGLRAGGAADRRGRREGNEGAAGANYERSLRSHAPQRSPGSRGASCRIHHGAVAYALLGVVVSFPNRMR